MPERVFLDRYETVELDQTSISETETSITGFNIICISLEVSNTTQNILIVLQNKKTLWLYFSDSRLKLLGVSGLCFFPQPKTHVESNISVLLTTVDHIWMYQ